MKQSASIITITGVIYSRIVERLIEDINYICKQENLQYFAFGELLKHAVHYNGALDYVEGKSHKYKIGLKRSDYEKLIKVLPKYSKERDYIISKHLEEDIKNKYRLPMIRLGKKFSVEGEVSLESVAYIYIAPFDKVPENLDVRKSFYRKLRRLRKIQFGKNECMSYLEGKDRGKDFKKGYSFSLFLGRYICYSWRNSNKIFNNIQKASQKYNNSDSNLLQNMSEAIGSCIREDQIFPTNSIKFGDTYISIPRDYTPWTRIYSGKDKERIKRIQKVNLTILEEMERVSSIIGVDYFLCGGNNLGYVRDGGFIPWDDDIDVGMLRADYNKFLAEANKYLNQDKFFLQTRESDPTIPFLFSKIRANNTLHIEKENERKEYHKGISIDIFPFDYIPNSEKETKEFVRQVRKKVRKHNYIANRQMGESVMDDSISSMGDKIAFWLGAINRKRYRAIPLSRSQQKYEKLATKYNNNAEKQGLHRIASFVQTYTWAEYDTIFPCQRIQFEGVSTRTMNKPELFLEMQYGNYMEVPPSHKQIGHSLVSWSVDIEKEGIHGY